MLHTIKPPPLREHTSRVGSFVEPVDAIAMPSRCHRLVLRNMWHPKTAELDVNHSLPPEATCRSCRVAEKAVWLSQDVTGCKAGGILFGRWRAQCLGKTHIEHRALIYVYIHDMLLPIPAHHFVWLQDIIKDLLQNAWEIVSAEVGYAVFVSWVIRKNCPWKKNIMYIYIYVYIYIYMSVFSTCSFYNLHINLMDGFLFFF